MTAEKAVIYLIRFSVLLQYHFLCLGRCIRTKETGSNCKIKLKFFSYLCLIDCYTLTYQRNQTKMCHIHTSHSEKQSVVIDKQKWNITVKSWVKTHTQINRIMLCCCYALTLERPAVRFWECHKLQSAQAHPKSSLWKTVTALHTTGWGEVLPPRATAKGGTTSSSSSSINSYGKGLPAACSLAKIKELGKLVTETREGRGWGVKEQ